MTRRPGPALFLTALAALAAAAAAGSPAMIVVCAPGYPGSTMQAEPTMEIFAAAAARAAGWSEADLGAVYYETEQGGIDRLKQDDAAFALVTLPFFLAHREEMSCRARLQVVQEAGSKEVFSLVAHKGSVASAAALAGWEVTGRPGFAPAFVRGVLLGGWGSLPSDTAITFTPRSLSALRRAAAGEKIAVILDAKEAAALDALPFAADLEIVTRSAPVPSTILCAVDGRAEASRAEALVKALLALHESPEGADALGALQMVRFEEVDAEALGRAEKAYSGR